MSEHLHQVKRQSKGDDVCALLVWERCSDTLPLKVGSRKTGQSVLKKTFPRGKRTTATRRRREQKKAATLRRQ